MTGAVLRSAPTTVGLVPIDLALAKRVRAVAQAAEKKREERDELILKAHEAGASYREIAALVGLSHVGVMKIVSKLEAEHIQPVDPEQPQPDNLLIVTPEENRRLGRKA